MSTSKIKRALTTALACCLVLSMSSVAFAAPPIKYYYGPFQLYDYVIAECGDFDVLWSGTVAGQVKIFFDKDGNWTKYFDHSRVVQHDSTYYNSEHPEIWVSGGPGESEFQKSYPYGYLVIVPLRVKITIPGRGVVVHEVGRVIFDTTTWEKVFQSGPSDVSGDTTALCELLSP